MPSNEFPQNRTPARRATTTRTLLWVALVISAACNATTSAIA
ncbi:MAG TPA: hypothetical protein VGP26_13575 [Actinophytocola sp.]|nr:hypothetical protein [Actinophytocola sp.]